MKLLSPKTVAEATAMLAETEGRALPIAGATDLLVHWPNRLDLRQKTFLDLGGLDEIRAHRWTDDELILGGLTTYWDIVRDKRAAAEFRVLVDAARTVGSVQIQAHGTWAGNIVNASPAADGVPAMMARDAVVEFASPDGVEEVRLDEFYLGYKQMRRRPDQIITAIRMPRRPHSVELFFKVGSRKAQAITKVGLAAAKSEAGWRVVVNSMAPTVRRCPTVERMLDNQSPVDSPGDFDAALRTDVAPIDDIRSTAAYRIGVLARVLFYELGPHCPWFGRGGGTP